MAAETQTQQAGAANEKAEVRSPVLWGRRERLERLSLTVMNGKLWFHVYVGGRHVESVGVGPREIAKLGGIGKAALQVAEGQEEEYARELAAREGFLGWGR